MKDRLKQVKFILGMVIFLSWMSFHHSVLAQSFSEVPEGYTGIFTFEDLSKVREKMDGKYILMNDIELGEATGSGGLLYHDGLGWEPIGTASNPFTGELNGNNYEISGLKISNRKEPSGLFGVAAGAVIKDVGIVNGFFELTKPAEAASSYYYGGLIGKASETVVEGVYGQVDILSNANSTFIGGLIGQMAKSEINNSFSFGNITVNRPVSNPYYIRPSTTAGTLAGLADNSSIISNSYSIGRLAVFAQSYDASKGILSKGHPKISNSYYLKDSNNQAISDIKARSLDELLQQKTYLGFDFVNEWEMDAKASYPFPRPKAVQIQLKENKVDFAGGMGTVFNPYKIVEPAHLNASRNHSNAYFELEKNIDLSKYSAWEPIGTDREPFTGNFQGNGYIVSGLTVNLVSDKERAAGLFGYAEFASIDRLNVRSGTIQVRRGSALESVYAGGIAGKLSNSSISNSSTDVEIIADSQHYSYAGGISGDIRESEILKSYNLGDIRAGSGDYAGYSGGIIGIALDSQIEQVYNAGNITASSNFEPAYAGGVAGSLIRGRLTDAYTLGAVHSSSWLDKPFSGALLGSASLSDISHSYGIGRFSESSLDGEAAAELIGTRDNANVSSSFYYNSLSEGIRGEENPYLKTREELQQASTFEGFDFQEVWALRSSTEYQFPVLKNPEFAASEKATAVKFKLLPKKLKYKAGEELDISGAVLAVESNFQRTYEVAVTPEMLSSQFYSHQLGKQRISVSYGNFSLDFTVTVEENVPEKTERISGVSRYETAIAISKKGWNTAETVVLATGLDFPDALAGGPLAYQENAPMLLTRPASLLAETEKELLRLKAKKVIILGSKGAVSLAVEERIKKMGLAVERIGGSSRFDTARLIAQRLPSDKAVVAYGFNFPDVLAVSPYAAKNGIPILLTRTDRLPEETKQALNNKKSTIVVGSTGAVNAEVFKQLPQAVRFGGKTRFDTAKEINLKLPLGTDQAYAATGKNFPDALAGSVLAAKNNSSILLVNEKSIPTATYDLLSRYRDFWILGSIGAVGDEVKSVLDEELKKQHQMK